MGNFVRVNITSVKDICDITQNVIGKYVFRGQEFQGWYLFPKQEREFSKEEVKAYNKKVLDDFNKVFPSSLEGIKGQAFAEFLLKKHEQGDDLKLLDFTKSFLVAVYFAIKDRSVSKSAVYAVSIAGVLSNFFYELTNESKREYHISEVEKYGRIKLYDYCSNNKTGIFYLEPDKNHSNSKYQQTVYLLNSSTDKNFSVSCGFDKYTDKSVSEFLKINSAFTIVKFIISSELKDDILDYLNFVNINDNTLMIEN